MKSWDSAQYLRFAAERTRPCCDLITAVPLTSPRRIIDLGCGPGNSTAALADRWPDANITGLDSSPEMLAQARTDHPALTWERGEIATWTGTPPFDLVFSNAALQWVPDHSTVYPHLLRQVTPDGVLAIQVPASIDAVAHCAMRDVAARSEWSSFFSTPVREWYVDEVDFYYDLLAPHASHLDLWLTDYLHVMESPAAIAEWYRGSGLRPFLRALPDDATRERFVAAYVLELEKEFPRRADGRVLFPFRRLFLIARPA